MAQQNSQLTNDNIMRIGTAFFSSRVLFTALELDLFSVLATQGPLNYEQLKQELGLQARGAQDFLDILVALKLLRFEKGYYANTDETNVYLDRNKKTYSGYWLEMADERLYHYWGHLTKALQTGKPQNEFKEDDNPFELIYATQASIDKFLSEMGDVSSPLVGKISEVFPWKDKQSFVDVGGCKGVFPVHLTTLQPHLRGGVFDLPQIQTSFERYVAGHGLSDQVTFHAGDFFVNDLPSADVLVMGHVLVDWDVQTRKMLIAKAFNALPGSGALLIYDMMIDDTRRENIAGLMMSLNMLIETQGGSTYTELDCLSWLKEAGFHNLDVVKLNKTHSLAIAYKP